MNNLMKKYFEGIHGLVPSKPKSREPLVGRVSDLRLNKKRK